MCPEIFLGMDYDHFMADVWAVGVTIYCLASGHFPFEGSSSNVLLAEINRGYTQIEPKYGPLIEIINSCLQIEPKARPTMYQLKIKILDSMKSSPDTNPNSASRVLSVIAKHHVIPGIKRLSPTSSGILGY
ncbi:hypothetical protein TVAG_292210 [Trichomonas vaginalis G3]|uniref:Protein kinase domain-containing protein n=1 Tax=Trichomonas vaginalis (strain ATCC PRA-98 / G3) TaxID=412133 RepID=A2G7D1_TRIV3|nr:protein kinase protein [Trichomonas vaginalis G3]EAX86937.1 hypothetical protein TVAG_292210 [Trichomonas vaginalis G3]KAI5510699.1 protein kinase protein [Trichomonas vaginalis G3]|eukprot:XP_001299867.1 hypothetical protein [Trichomonas vaginalis G3]